MTDGHITRIEDAFKLCRRSFLAIGAFSFVINLLMLTPMFYMINIFDKAVGTGSFPTLYALAAIAIFLYVVLATLEAARSWLLTYVATRFDIALSPRLFNICFSSAAGSMNAVGVGQQPLADLNSLRQFLGSSNCAVFFDLPWIPFFIVLMYLFHPALVVVALLSMAVMVSVALANQRATTAGLLEATRQNAAIASATHRNLQNAEVASAMGMVMPLTERWRAAQDQMLEVQTKTSLISGSFTAATKTLATAVQSIAITTGAVLAITQQISPGVMIGAALLLGKTIQPIQQAVSGWQSFVNAKDQYLRLRDLLEEFPPNPPAMKLPDLKGRVSAYQAYVKPPGAESPTLFDINFDLPAGTVTMIIGPSAAGKSSLIRSMLGLWPTMRGDFRIDGARSSQFERAQLGHQLGYLPQGIELFDGTVAENIARFGEVDPDLVVSAAEEAGVHNMILALPKGYDTVLGGSLGMLSPGQRQRIALARALYGHPNLLFLDEPNSNLDDAGEQALGNAIAKMKARGSSVVIVSHRQGALSLADYLIVMSAGRIQYQGPRDSVLAKLKSARVTAEGAPTKIASSPVTAVAREDG